MGYQNVFKRYEMKYLLTQKQQTIIQQRMAEHMVGDAYGRSTICNIYFDTPDYILARRSIEGPVYKEKLRLRSYGVAKPDSTVFVELKKKYKSVVYKRRANMPLDAAMRYLCAGEPAPDSQIIREIDYCLDYYQTLRPAVVLSYDREAFYDKDDPGFRVTFDSNILWRDYDLRLNAGIYGTPILQSGQTLMEIKTGTAIPLWMTHILSELGIRKTSFSKYGNAYRTLMQKQTLEATHYAG